VTVFFTDQILEAVQTLLKSGMTFTATIVQKMDLMFWPELDVSTKVPAIFIKPIEVEVEPEHQGVDVTTVTKLRIVVVDSFDPTSEDVVQKRINRAEDVADRLVGSTGDGFDIGGSTITGFELHNAIPVSMDLEPAEDGLVSFNQERQLFAVSVDVEVYGRAIR